MLRIVQDTRTGSARAAGVSPARGGFVGSLGASGESEPGRIVLALLGWFAHAARDLPWRRTSDPYAIWVSEIMLQQTQVRKVVPYWERWMRRIPSLKALAQASDEVLHKLWEGLGYYRRVRHMRMAARLIMARHRGTFPATFEEVLALPGIGRYTAGAICSIAFNQPTPVLDGNVIRVLTRLYNVPGDPRREPTNSRLWEIAERLVRLAGNSKLRPRNRRTLPRNRLTPGPCSVLNQSLMELGALVCTPKNPQCSDCPVADWCRARRQGRVEHLPQKARRPVILHRRSVVLVVQQGNRFWVRRRPEGVVNGRLWEFPNTEAAQCGSLAGPLGHSTQPTLYQLQQAGSREMQSLTALFEPPDAGRKNGSAPFTLLRRPTKPTRFCTIKHSITRYRITAEVLRAKIPADASLRLAEGRWLTLAQMSRLAFCRAHQRILQRLGNCETSH